MDRFFDEDGYPKVILQSDGESNIIAECKALVRARSRGGKDIVTQISLRQPSAESSNGLPESTVKSVEGLTRPFARDAGKKYGVIVKGNLAILGWIVRHAAYVLNRFMVMSSPAAAPPLKT